MGVYANNRSIIHSGDGGTHTAAPPDVCKTPSPGGPVPIPYVNLASSSDLAQGTKQVKIEGNPTANAGSNLSTSSGDEAGTAGGGVVSSKFKGKMTWTNTSIDVKSEGKGVARFMDPTQQNGNSSNTAFRAMGGTGVAYFDDFRGKCNICQKGAHTHQVLEKTIFYNTIVAQMISGNASLVAEDERRYKNNTLPVAQRQQMNNPPWVQQKRLACKNQGFMVGVMLCKTKKQKIWAISGSKPLDPEKDKELIKYICCAYDLDLYVNTGLVTPEQIMASNPLLNDTNNPRTTEIRRRRFLREWGVAARRNENGMRGWSRPGNCAAAKLVASSHIPFSLTEFFFDPITSKKPWDGGPYKWRETRLSNRQQANFEAREGRGPGAPWSIRIRNHKLAQMASVQFQANADTVASCHTCQHLLYRAMCNVQSRTCGDTNTAKCTC